MTLASILLVDNDAAARRQIAAELRELGHQVAETADAGSALAAAKRACPDLMVCEFALPDITGIELLSDVRRSEEFRKMRVLMTSARSGGDDAVAALRSGADDFIGKPINMGEFIARVGACLSRPPNLAGSDVVSAGGISIDNVGHRVTVDGKHLLLAPREYRLLQFLLTNPDRVFTRRQLLMHVWDREMHVGPRTVDVHIRRLRSVLEPYGREHYLQTVRGTGYRFSLDT